MRSIRTIFKLFILSGLLLSVVSCEKFLNPEVDTELKESDNYKDYLSSRASVNGLYGLLQDLMDAYIVNGELRGDLLQITENANQDLKDIYNLNYSADNRYINVRSAYNVIANSTDVIFHLNRLIADGTSYEDELNNMHAEAVVVRAWVYFYLYRSYKDAPYLSEDYTTSGTSLDPVSWLEQNSSSSINLETLIAEVKTVIPGFIANKVSGSAFFNIASANALLGEMYLWKDDYSSAVDALLASVSTGNNSRFILDSDLQTSKWLNIFKGDESASDEMMTKIIFDKGEKQENDLLSIFSKIGASRYELAPVSKVYSMLQGTNRYAGSFKNDDEVGKYTRSNDNPYTSDMPVILYRAADVHLMLAEAYNRLGNVELALDLLNSGSDSLFTIISRGVRGRVGLSAVSVEGTDLSDSILNLENMILEERGKELAFEGKRWFDLLRITKRRGNEDLLVALMMSKYPLKDEDALRSLFSSEENWYLPVK